MGALSETSRGIRFGDLVRAALGGLRLYRTRSALTIATFGAGTAAAVALLAMTGGARAELLARLGRLGADHLAVRAVGEAPRDAGPVLTLADAAALDRSLPFVRDVAPVRTVPATVLLPDQPLTVEVVGTTPDYFALRGLAFRRGRPFSIRENEDGHGVCVAGDATARALARQGPVYGQWVKVGTRWCRVVGVLAPDGGFRTGDEDRRLYVPIRGTLRENLSRRQSLDEIRLRVTRGVDPEAAARAVRRALLRRHGTERFVVQTAHALLREKRETRGLLDVLLAAVAILALGLGGIALASQTWQSVSIRRQEIAIRRAIGARRGEILAQFLLEGSALAIAGALSGAAVGALGSAFAASLGGWPWLLPSWRLCAVLVAIVALGLAATLYPAHRAAELDPVAALRLER